MATIAFLGLGHMGGPMAANLRRRRTYGACLRPSARAEGMPRRPGRTRLRQRRRKLPRTADVVITSLPNGDIVKACYAEVLPAAKQGTLFIDTSTISVDDARAIHNRRPSTGLAQLDAPVSGGVKGATAGTLAFMVGGEADAVERARPVLEPLAGKIIHCGGFRHRPGRQVVQQHGARGAADRCRRGVRARREARAVRAVPVRRDHRRDGNCWAVHTNCPVPGPVPTSPANNDFKPGFATALMNKDIGLAMDAVNSDRIVSAAGQPRRGDLR